MNGQTPTETMEPQPLIVRQAPPKTARLDKKKLLGAVCLIGGALVVVMGVKLQGRQTALSAGPPQALPGAHEVAGGQSQSIAQMLRIPSSYEGLDRTPKAPPDPPPPVSPPPPPPVAVQPPPAPPPPAPVQQHAAAAPAQAQVRKAAPKRWLFAEMQQGGTKTGATAIPVSQQDESGDQSGPGVLGAPQRGGSPLVKSANWVKPIDPTKILYRAQIIHGKLLHAINSDIPGPVRVLVTKPVMDRFGQGVTLLPANTVLLGNQDGRPEYGQSRLPVVIDQAQLPNGTILELGGTLSDQRGAVGLHGRTNHHLVRVGVGAVISAALSIGARAPFGDTQGYQPTLEQEFSKDIGQSVQRTSRSIIDRQLNLPPTVFIKHGSTITMYFEDNISLYDPPVPVR